MRTALEVESETAEKIRELARVQKVSVDQLLAAYVPGLASEGSNNSASDTGDKAEAFEEWAADFPDDIPSLSDEAISRASIYRDR